MKTPRSGFRHPQVEAVTVSPTPTSDPMMAAWLDIVDAVCQDATMYADPAEATLVPQPDGSALVAARDGITLRLRADQSAIEPVDGVVGLRPDPYVWCDSEVFLGTSSH